MRFLLDTSAYSAFKRGDARLKQYINASSDIVVPLTVIGELRAGFACGNKRVENEKLLRYFLDAANVSVVGLTDNTSSAYAAIYAELRKAGKPVGTNDMWIAAVAEEHRLPLVTLDKDFSYIPGLEVLELDR